MRQILSVFILFMGLGLSLFAGAQTEEEERARDRQFLRRLMDLPSNFKLFESQEASPTQAPPLPKSPPTPVARPQTAESLLLNELPEFDEEKGLSCYQKLNNISDRQMRLFRLTEKFSRDVGQVLETLGDQYRKIESVEAIPLASNDKLRIKLVVIYKDRSTRELLLPQAKLKIDAESGGTNLSETFLEAQTLVRSEEGEQRAVFAFEVQRKTFDYDLRIIYNDAFGSGPECRRSLLIQKRGNPLGNYTISLKEIEQTQTHVKFLIGLSDKQKQAVRFARSLARVLCQQGQCSREVAQSKLTLEQKGEALELTAHRRVKEDYRLRIGHTQYPELLSEEILIKGLQDWLEASIVETKPNTVIVSLKGYVKAKPLANLKEGFDGMLLKVEPNSPEWLKERGRSRPIDNNPSSWSLPRLSEAYKLTFTTSGKHRLESQPIVIPALEQTAEEQSEDIIALDESGEYGKDKMFMQVDVSLIIQDIDQFELENFDRSQIIFKCRIKSKPKTSHACEAKHVDAQTFRVKRHETEAIEVSFSFKKAGKEYSPAKWLEIAPRPKELKLSLWKGASLKNFGVDRKEYETDLFMLAQLFGSARNDSFSLFIKVCGWQVKDQQGEVVKPNDLPQDYSFEMEDCNTESTDNADYGEMDRPEGWICIARKARRPVVSRGFFRAPVRVPSEVVVGILRRPNGKKEEVECKVGFAGEAERNDARFLGGPSIPLRPPMQPQFINDPFRSNPEFFLPPVL